MIMTQFAGQQLQMIDIFDRHNVGRPFIKRNYKDALLKLEKEGRILAEPSNRRAGTFADNVFVVVPEK